MSEDSRILNGAVPTLLHPDLHKRNIFVSEDDCTVITAIIDLQSASVEPAFWHADHIPDFATGTPDSSDRSDHNGELCAEAFDARVRFLISRVVVSRLLDESLFAHSILLSNLKEGAVAFRHTLVETSQHWTKLGLPDSCPFTTPAPKELVVHQQQYQRFVAAQELKCGLSGLHDVASDGWLPLKAWEMASLAH